LRKNLGEEKPTLELKKVTTYFLEMECGREEKIPPFQTSKLTDSKGSGKGLRESVIELGSSTSAERCPKRKKGEGHFYGGTIMGKNKGR